MTNAVYSGMRNARWFCAVLVCASACAVEDGELRSTDTTTPGELTVDDTLVLQGAASTEPDDVCSLLPPDGPCALACDEEALAEQYVPAGVCAAFLCELTDGRSIAVHACRAGD